MRRIQQRAFLSVDPRNVGLAVLAVSSVLFALEHHLWFAGLLAGMVYALLYRRAANLGTAVLAHAISNGKKRTPMPPGRAPHLATRRHRLNRAPNFLYG